MHRRLVLAFIGLAAVVILAFGAARAVVIVDMVEDHQEALLSRSADAAHTVVSQAVRDGRPVTTGLLAELAGEGERLEYQPADGAPVVWPLASGEASEDVLATERDVTDGGRLVVSVSPDGARDEIVSTLAPLLGMSLLLLLLAGAAGWLLARRLARPFADLAEVAEDFGRGHLDAEVPHYAMPEADAIARALEDGADTVRRLLRREREVSDSASHELRTPITALRLTLEDLSMWPDTPPTVAAELARIVGEVDRFSDAVTNLVDPDTQPGPGSPTDVPSAAELVDLTALVQQAVQERDGGPGSGIRSEAGAPVMASMVAETTRRAVDLLVEHAVSRSDSPAVARVRDGNGYVTVEVDGSSAAAASAGTEGVVWDQVAGLAVELGGRAGCTRGTDRHETWSLTLPKRHAGERP